MMWVVMCCGLFLLVWNFLDFCRENVKYAAMISELNRIRRVLLAAINPPAWWDVFPNIWFGLKVVFSAGDVPSAGPVVGLRRFVRGYNPSLKEAPPYGT